MMGLFVRTLLAVGGRAAAFLGSRNAPNLPLVQAMLALVAAVLALAAAVVLQPAAAWLFKRRVSPCGRAAPERWRSRPWAP